ncbi:MAG: leucine-rich repeat protein [Oscillospiraceae bacterium]|nr:leucine-rich repeat protein [Oscillospiraceae bacterium]
MKYKKNRSVSLILTFALAISLFAAFPPSASAAEIKGTVGTVSTGNYLEWIINDNTKVLTITGKGTVNTINDYSRYGAPWQANRAMVEEIKLDNIAVIGNYAFADFGNLKKVTVDTTQKNITRFGNYAFSGCADLTDINDHNGLTLIPANLTVIGNYAFEKCAKLERLNLSNVNNITTLGTNAFIGCNTLSFIRGGSSGPDFTGRFYIDPRGVLIEKNNNNANGTPLRIIKASATLSGVYEIEPTVTTVNAEAFMICAGLESVTLPSSVTTIGDRAFSGCSSLKTAVFQGNAPRSFGNDVFKGAHSDFTITYYPGGTGWTSPNWSPGSSQTYPAIVSNFYVTLDKNVVYIEKGATAEIRAVVNPTTVKQSVKWYVDNGAVARISSTETANGVTGVVHGLEVGETTVHAVAESGGNTATASSLVIVTEKIIPVSNLRLDETRLTIPMPEDPNDVPLDEQVELTAVLYPNNATDQTLVWESSNTKVAYTYPYTEYNSQTNEIAYKCKIIPVAAGTTTITVRTFDGKLRATCTVTVTAVPTFVPVSNLTLASSVMTIAMGATVKLNDFVTVSPTNATNKSPIEWRVDFDKSTVEVLSAASDGILPDSVLSVEWGKTGTVVLEAEVIKGVTDSEDWGYSSDLGYKKTFTITVGNYAPATGITGLPGFAFVGEPFELKATVNPTGATYKDIEWELDPGDTGAYIDPVSGKMIAQRPGVVILKATVKNGLLNSDMLEDLTREFIVFVREYEPFSFTLHATPGGSARSTGSARGTVIIAPAGGSNSADYSNNEKITVSASPIPGYQFAGWSSTNGGSFEDTQAILTEFTMPSNKTTVYAYFTYTGLSAGNTGGGSNYYPNSGYNSDPYYNDYYYDPYTGNYQYNGGGYYYVGGSGGYAVRPEVVLPNTEYYFSAGSAYTTGTGAPFSIVVMRDYQLFNRAGSITLDGRILVRNQHYFSSAVNSHTQITFQNGYLDTLGQGTHTMVVNFGDNRSISAVFTIVSSRPLATSYSDVYSTDWYYSSVSFVSSRGWMGSSSFDSMSFRPSDPATQGEVIDALYMMAGSPSMISMYGYPLQGREASYAWVLSKSILPIGSQYNLTGAISRQDIALLLARFISIQNMRYNFVRNAPVFADEWNIDSLARGAVYDLYRAGVLNGRTPETFVPSGNITRAELAVILNRFWQAFM